MKDNTNIINEIYSEMNKTYSIDDARIVGSVNNESMAKKLGVILNHLNYTKDARVLDFGCGSMLSMYTALGKPEFNYIGVDCNLDSIRRATWHHNLPYSPTFPSEFSKSTLTDDYLLNSVHNRFDIIIAKEVFQDFPSVADCYECVNKLCGLLDTDGVFLFTLLTNRLNRLTDHELFLSPLDVHSMAISTGLKYTITMG